MKYRILSFLSCLLPLLAVSCLEKETPTFPPISGEKDPVKPVGPEPVEKLVYIQDYMGKYHPGVTFGLGGIHPETYFGDAGYRKTADDNFQIFTLGNAMKNSSVVKADGSMNFSEIDRFFQGIPSDKQLYGHNFLWHSQQAQAYYYSLIAPTLLPEAGQKPYGTYNLLDETSFNFNDGRQGGWRVNGSSAPKISVREETGLDASPCLVLENPTGVPGQHWAAQCTYTFDHKLEAGKTYIFRFLVRAARKGTLITLQYQNHENPSDQGGFREYSLGTDWSEIVYEMKIDKPGMDRIIINFGKTEALLSVDNVEFYLQGTAPAPAKVKRYRLKTPEEKKTALLAAMEEWIRTMARHPGMEKVVAWDVINEPIGEDGRWRGIEGVWVKEDKAPVENEYDGLQLNWANGHFFWGTFIGKEYACKAFEYARKYCRPEADLYVNDYNLHNPRKADGIVKYVQYIDQHNATGGPLVDGIGTQMHVGINNTRHEFDVMFQKLAATGKKVRVTELDVKVRTLHPTPQQLEKQAQTFRDVVESYFANVPQPQQSGITVWGLYDGPKRGWLADDCPNLFDAQFRPKPAYYAVCKAIAGEK